MRHVRLFEEYILQEASEDLLRKVMKLAEEKYPAPRPVRPLSKAKRGEYERAVKIAVNGDHQQDAFIAAVFWHLHRDVHGITEKRDKEIAKEQLMNTKEKLHLEKRPKISSDTPKWDRDIHAKIPYDREAASAAFDEGIKWAIENRGKLQGEKFGF